MLFRSGDDCEAVVAAFFDIAEVFPHTFREDEALRRRCSKHLQAITTHGARQHVTDIVEQLYA